MINRESLVKRLSESLSNVNFLALYGSSGMGKSVLSYQICINTGLAWKRIEMRGLTPAEINHRLLTARKAIEASPGSNLLIDDLNFDKEVHVYDKALDDFLNVAKRTSSKVIISSQNTLPIELASLYAAEPDSSVSVPTLDIDDIKKLASIHGCPQGSKLSQWSSTVWAQTKGHPLLAHARVLNIARKGWPAPTAEELLSSFSLDEARQKVRQKLEETLGADERTLVYRVSVFTDRFKRENALVMARHSPSLPLGGEIFDRLIGPWIEPLDSEYFRLSPLLEGNATKVFGAEETKSLHRSAADSIIEPKTVSHVEFGGLLMHGLLGDYPKAFFVAMMGWLGLSDEHELSIADYVEWFKYAPRDKPLISDPFGNLFARMLQFEIAAHVDVTAAAEIALRWEVELQKMPSDESASPEFLLRSFEARFLQTVLFTDAVPFTFEKIAIWTARMLSTLPHLSRSFEEIPQEIRREDPNLPEVFESLQNPAFFLGNIIVKCKHASEAVAFLTALDTADSGEVEIVWQLLLEQPSAVVLLVDRIWLDDATSPSPDWQKRLDQLDAVIEIAIRRKVDSLTANAYVAKAIIYQEYLSSTASAVEQLNIATKRLGHEHDEIANYRAKVFLLERQYAEAVTIWRALLPKLVQEKYYGRLFFCRDAQTAAAALNQWDEVAEFALLGAEMATNAHWAYPAATVEDLISVSFRGDAAIAYWKKGDFQPALSELEGILESLLKTPVESLDDKSRLLYIRLQFVVTWMASDSRGAEYPAPPAGFFTNPEKFEEVVRDAKTVPYVMLWYLMAESEFRTKSGDKYLSRLQKELKLQPNRLYQFAAAILLLKRSVSMGDVDSLITAYNSLISEFGEKEDIPTIMGDLKRLLFAAIILLAYSPEISSNIPFETWKSDLRTIGYGELAVWLEQFQVILGKDTHSLITTLVSENAQADERIISAAILTFTDALAPRERFYANAVFLTSSNLGNWQDLIGGFTGERFAFYWKQIALFQRFALRNPGANAPAILSAAQADDRRGFAKAASILLVSSRAIDLVLGETALQQLTELVRKSERAP